MSEHKQASHFTVDGKDGGAKVFTLPTINNDRSAPTSTLMEASQELATIRANLGFLNAIGVDRKINRDAKRVIIEGYMQFVEARRQELIAKITIGLAESKKKLLVESLRMSGEIDKEISELSAHFTAAMFDGALSANFAAAEEEHRRLEQIEAGYKAGKLTENRYNQLREATVEAADHVTQIVKTNVAQIIHAHVGQIKVALELFRERTLSKAF